MRAQHVDAIRVDESFSHVPVLLALVSGLAVTGPLLAAGSVPSALCAATVFGATLWRPRLALVVAIPAFLLATALGVNATFLVGLPIAAAMFAAFVAGELRVEGWRHLAMAGLAMWVLGSVLFIPAAPFLQTSRLSDVMGFLLGLVLAAAALSVGPSTAHIRTAVVLSTVLLAAGVLLGTHETNLDGRPTAYGLGPNSLGLLMAMGLVCAVIELHSGNRLVAVLALPAQAAGLWTTQSRGALVAVGGGLVAYAIGQMLTTGSRQRGLPVAGVTALIAVALGAVVYVVGDGGFGVRSASSLDANNASRGTAASYSVQLAAEHPLLGVGYGNFASHSLVENGLYINTHNDFLRLAAETGMPGLALFLLVLAGILGGFRSPEWRRTFPLLITFLVGHLFMNNLSLLAVASPFWVTLGALASSRFRTAAVPASVRPASRAPVLLRPGALRR